MAKGKTIAEVKKEMRQKAIKALEESLLMIEADAKLLVGVKTATLKRSMTHNIEETEDKIKGEVGSYGVDYAYYHSLDNPYLEDARDMNLEAIRRKIKDVLQE
ncbi:hypothetical protein EDC18_102421 [Natranaerovirga pectinivora]|uniref:Uncharacterized protein n=1 Tax=Natranaerovirga pectinivora TaxID=682400 RepID=A0A4R3MPD6_9FIRM|nr:hypothetical protein [Natranaerovirga pectinivora]TCT16402.1 hypothetical protein EDC18_102421 [Natranaerovirga pectinivora]